MAFQMKNNIVNLKKAKPTNYTQFTLPREKFTIFSVSKWNTLKLHAKIQKHGNFSCYLEYLIDRYSDRIYQGFPVYHDHLHIRVQIKNEEKILLKCKVFESTLLELHELAVFAEMGKAKLFRLLLDWDLNPTKPSLRMAI